MCNFIGNFFLYYVSTKGSVTVWGRVGMFMSFFEEKQQPLG